MKICDTHTHSNNSFDGKSSVEQMCQSAIEKGLYAIAITDHCEAPLIKEGEKSRYGYFDRTIPQSINHTIIAKEKYSSKLKVLIGIELGEPIQDIECTQRALSYGKYDIVIASVHNLLGMEDFYYLDYKKENISNLLNIYFDELIQTALNSDFDTLAHITYPLRYIKRDTGLVPDLTEFQGKLDTLYKILINNNKALEINVSGLYNGLDDTLPGKYQVQRYKQLGGKYITIGSDAHCSCNVGREILAGIEIAKTAGFSHYTIYENRTPILIDI